MATLVDGVEVEVLTAYGVRFSDGEIVELDDLDEAQQTASFITGAQVVTSRVYMEPWTDYEV